MLKPIKEEAEEILAKHWTKATSKPLDEATKNHLNYAIEAVAEGLLANDKEVMLWETTMMKLIGEDGLGSVIAKIKQLKKDSEELKYLKYNEKL